MIYKEYPMLNMYCDYNLNIAMEIIFEIIITYNWKCPNIMDS